MPKGRGGARGEGGGGVFFVNNQERQEGTAKTWIIQKIGDGRGGGRGGRRDTEI